MTQAQATGIDRSVVIDPEKLAQKVISKPKHFVFQCDIEAATTGLNTFLILRIATLNKYAPLLVKAIKELPKLRTVFLLDDKSNLDLFFDYLKDEDNSVRAKVFEVLYFSDSKDQMNRMMHAWCDGSQDQFIARAHVMQDELVVTSFGLQTFRINFGTISSLRSIPVKQRDRFKILNHGRNIHWDNADIDINLEIIRYHTDPRFRTEQNLRALNIYGLCGQAIQHLRGDLTREAMYKRGGPSAKQLARIESSPQAPTLNMLARMAKAHGTSQHEYIKKLLQVCDELESAQIATFKSKKAAAERN